MKYRKKPVVVDAFRWAFDIAPDWWKELKGVTIVPNTGSALIPTPEGVEQAKVGDYIIRGEHGEVYSCKPDIFEESYEPVSDDKSDPKCPECHLPWSEVYKNL